METDQEHTKLECPCILGLVDEGQWRPTENIQKLECSCILGLVDEG